MQAVSAQSLLLRKSRPPKNSVFDSVNRSCSSRNAEQSAAVDSRLNNSPVASDDNYCQDPVPPPRPCCSGLAFQNSEKTPRLRRLSKGDRAAKLKSLKYQQKPRSAVSLTARSNKQKPDVLRVPADDEDIEKFYQPPNFTLRDFIVQFSDSEDVPVSVVEKSLYSASTYCRLQNVIEERRKPRNTRLSTQLLQLPDDLPGVHKRVPHKQLLIEMAALIKEHLSKVVYILI